MRRFSAWKRCLIFVITLVLIMIMTLCHPWVTYAVESEGPAIEETVSESQELLTEEAAPESENDAVASEEAVPESEEAVSETAAQESEEAAPEKETAVSKKAAEASEKADADDVSGSTDPVSEDYVPDNGIPVVYLEIDESRGTIAAMNADVDHKTKCYGTIRIDVPEGFHYSDFPDLTCESLSSMAMDIRGRGNSTWEADKKPYKIKLDKKTDVFGLGKNKHWVLIANTYDNTFIRDRITAWLGDQVDFGFTPRGVPVDLVMKGDQFGTHYLGSYYLSENVRVDDNRLELDELEESDTTEPAITGGYLLQNSLQTRFGSPDIFTTKNSASWATHTPTFDVEADEDAYENPAQQQYIQNFIQRIDDGLFSDDYKDKEGADYRDLMDLRTAAMYWLVNQITMNGDAYQTGSTYIYKVRDTDGQIGKVYWGPLWDYDNAWNYMPDTTGFSTDFVWETAFLYDTREGGFVEEVKKQWPAFKAALDSMRADGGLIDKYYEETKKSAEADRAVNPVRGIEEGETVPTYEECIQSLKDWIMYRSIWIDYHLNDLDTIMHKVKFVADDEVYKMKYIRDGASYPFPDKYPEKEGFVFLGWYDENDQKLDTYVDAEATVTEDVTFTAKYLSNEEATHGEDIIFQVQSDIIDYSLHAERYDIMYSVIPKKAQDRKVKWTSSDESIATVDEDGVVTYYQRGTVTFTGTLYSGISKDFTLTITDSPIPHPDSIRPEKEVITLSPGQQAGVTLVTEPSPAHLSSYFVYKTDDFDVAVVDSRGVITARGVGETKIRVITEAYDEDWNTYTYETEVTVIVTEEKEDPEPAVYTVVSGDKPTWTKGSGKDLTITVKRSVEDETCFDHFTELLLDGKALTIDQDYTAVRGSTVVTVGADTLEKLDAGNHAATVAFDDGKAEVALTIADAETPDETERVTEESETETSETIVPDKKGNGTDGKSGKDSGNSSKKSSRKSSSAAKTGDSANPVLWWTMLAASAAVLILVRKRKKTS